jgi:EAL domain-containing protein (putative c-di-GMP-specific phosphodiesterase class I)
VTAEGIETANQAAILRAAGCDQLQGYMVGKPVPADEISRRLLRKDQSREYAGVESSLSAARG